jgi:hypothetical protein
VTGVTFGRACSRGDDCGLIFQGNASRSPSDDEILYLTTSQSRETYKGWRFVGISTGAFTPFSPEDYPFDMYSTDMHYLCVSPSTMMPGIIQLNANVPAPFIATFANIGTVSGKDLPNNLLGYQDCADGVDFAFLVSVIRSPTNLLLSSIYTVFPGLTIYEVSAISLISVDDQKTRLSIYVGILFSAFAYFFTLRQLLPPYPTYIEGIIGVGLTAWILVEGYRAVLHP